MFGHRPNIERLKSKQDIAGLIRALDFGVDGNKIDTDPDVVAVREAAACALATSCPVAVEPLITSGKVLTVLISLAGLGRTDDFDQLLRLAAENEISREAKSGAAPRLPADLLTMAASDEGVRRAREACAQTYARFNQLLGLS